MTDQPSTVEEFVRHKLSVALGGPRGIVEGAVPIVAFTVAWLATSSLRLSLGVAIGIALALLAVRLVQRSNPQFVLNAGVGIAIAAVFAARSGHARDVFLPGILISAGWAALFLISILIRWPAIGLMIGGITGDLTTWRQDLRVRRLYSLLTWPLTISYAIRAAVLFPLWRANEVVALGTAKVLLGWPLHLVAIGAMIWLLGRNHTPLEPLRPTPAATS